MENMQLYLMTLHTLIFHNRREREVLRFVHLMNWVLAWQVEAAEVWQDEDWLLICKALS